MVDLRSIKEDIDFQVWINGIYYACVRWLRGHPNILQGWAIRREPHFANDYGRPQVEYLAEERVEISIEGLI